MKQYCTYFNNNEISPEYHCDYTEMRLYENNISLDKIDCDHIVKSSLNKIILSWLTEWIMH